MNNSRYEVSIYSKENYFSVIIKKDGYIILSVIDNTPEKVVNRLSEVYTRRVNTKQFNDDTRVIEKSLRAFRGYVEC